MYGARASAFFLATLAVTVSALLLLAPAERADSEESRDIRIAFLSDAEHVDAFEYAVGKFNAEQESLGTGYRINATVVTTSAEAVGDDLEALYGLGGYRYFVGPLISATTYSALQFADAHDDTVFVSPSSEAISLAIPGDGLFRMAPDTSTRAPAVVANLEQQGKEYAVVIYRDDTWGRDMLASLTHEYDHSLELAIPFDGSPGASAAAQAASAVRDLVSVHGADRVAVVLVSFGPDVAELARAVLADGASADILDDVSWYGTLGAEDDYGIVSDAAVAGFLSSVSFTSTIYHTAPNPTNADLALQSFSGYSGFRANVYDAVFLLADTILVSGMHNGTQAAPDVRSLIIDVANGVASHDYHHADRVVGDGALGSYRLNAAGDLSEPVVYVTLVVHESTDGSFEWRPLAPRACR